MNKSELVEAIAEHAGLTKVQSGKALDAAIEAISNALKAGEEVTLVGFGSFYVADREARNGRNPRTGEVIEIAAAKQPKFKAGKTLKEAVQ